MKKQNHLKKVFLLLMLAILQITVSCSGNDEPVKPSDETKELGHDVWKKVEFIFKEGHLHGSQFHGDPDYQGLKYFSRQQKITYTYTDEGKIVADTDAPIRFLAGNTYGLVINYYNKKGELMNKEFVENGMDKIHQHFFHVEALTPTKGNTMVKEADLFNYTYRDTDPIDGDYKKNAVLKQRTWDAQNPSAYDPIGLKGYFTIPNESAYHNFNLKITLAHFKVKDKLDKNNHQPYAYNAKVAPLSYETDLFIKIPVHIYSGIEYQQTEALKEESFFPDAAKEFNTTVEEIKKEYDLLFDLDPEGSEFWM